MTTFKNDQTNIFLQIYFLKKILHRKDFSLTKKFSDIISKTEKNLELAK